MTKPLPVSVTPGDIVDIICETDSANPTATITWDRNSVILNQDDTYSITLDERAGENNANHRISILSFLASEELFGSVFNCVVLGQKSTLKAGGSALKGLCVEHNVIKIVTSTTVTTIPSPHHPPNNDQALGQCRQL